MSCSNLRNSKCLPESRGGNIRRKEFVDYGGPAYVSQQYAQQSNRQQYQVAKQHCFADIGRSSLFSGPKQCSNADKEELVTQIVWSAQNHGWTPEQLIQNFIQHMSDLSQHDPSMKLDAGTLQTLKNPKLTVSQSLAKIPSKYLVAYVI